MAEFAKPAEIGKAKLPPAVSQTSAGEFQRDADVVSEMSAAGVLSIIAGKTLQNAVRAPGYKVYRDGVLKASGGPSDPLESMMLEQAMVAHHRILHLHAQAAQAETPELIEVLNSAASKLTAEFRRLCLAVREYRSPVAAKNVTVVQQNLAGGHQQIALVDQRQSSSTPEKIESNPELLNQKALTHEVTSTFDSPILGLASTPTESLQRAG